jgi:hypothetical protein
MQRDIDRTCKVDCTKICGVSPTKNHREKLDVATRWVKNLVVNHSPYVLVILFSLNGSCSHTVACYPMTKFVRWAGLLPTVTIGQGCS